MSVRPLRVAARSHLTHSASPASARGRENLIQRRACRCRKNGLLRTRIPNANSGLAGRRWSATMAVPMCCFCGRTVDQVTHLIQGPELFICDICVDACIDTLATKDHGWRERQIDYLLRLKNRRAPLRRVRCAGIPGNRSGRSARYPSACDIPRCPCNAHRVGAAARPR